MSFLFSLCPVVQTGKIGLRLFYFYIGVDYIPKIIKFVNLLAYV